MRKCPECSRTFRNKNQSHYCRKALETIDEKLLSHEARWI